MAGWIDAWMPGSGPPPSAAEPDSYPGERLGLPAEGVGSTVGIGRRFAALTVDWLLGYLVAGLFGGSPAVGDPTFSWVVLGVWFVLTALPVAAFGASAGMVALGIRVASLGSTPLVGVPRAVLRTALIALVLPPFVRDVDGRGWHDRATRTVVVRTRG